VIPRRAFIATLTGSLIAAPLAVEAQQGSKVYRIGVLGLAPVTSEVTGPQPRSPYIKALLDGLRERGYVYGKQFVTEPRGAEGNRDRDPSLIDELLRSRVDVIVSVAAALPALKSATSTVPIVVMVGEDPASWGFVQSFSHPGGNITGLSGQGAELVGKRHELLRQRRDPCRTWPGWETAARARGPADQRAPGRGRPPHLPALRRWVGPGPHREKPD